MSWFGAPRRTPEAYVPPAGIPGPDVRRDLVLYQFDTCPYCQRVRRASERLGLTIPLAHTDRDPSARSKLIQVNGTSQVPCLFIDGVPLLESADIIDWLEAYAARGGSAV